MRTWLDDRPGYLPPVGIGEVIRAAGVGEVVETRCDAYQVGDITTLTGFRSTRSSATTSSARRSGRAISDHHERLRARAAPPHFGMKEVGPEKPGETVVGPPPPATGSIAGQVAKIAGARVVGIAGGPEKCRAVVRTSVLMRVSTTRTNDDAGRPSSGCVPQGRQRLLRQRRRRDPQRGARPTGPEGAGVLCGVISPASHRRIPVRPTTSTCSPDRNHAGIQRT